MTDLNNNNKNKTKNTDDNQDNNNNEEIYEVIKRCSVEEIIVSSNSYNSCRSRSRSTSSTRQKKQNNHQWTLNDFDIGKPLGKGKFGRVYLAREKRSEQQAIVALKMVRKKYVIKSKFENQICREILIHQKLKHRNVLRCYGYFDNEKTIYIILEYAPNGNLYQKLHREGAMNATMVATYIYEVSCALSYLHLNAVIHRDLKPENILLGIFYEAKLADFGWSVKDESFFQSRLTLCGTLDYLPPEMLERKSYDERVDIWCLGVLLYELLVGQVPFCFSTATTTGFKLDQFIEKGLGEFPASVSADAVQLIKSVNKKRKLKSLKCSLLIK
jgi:serine/threonine protein kinase